MTGYLVLSPDNELGIRLIERVIQLYQRINQLIGSADVFRILREVSPPRSVAVRGDTTY